MTKFSLQASELNMPPKTVLLGDTVDYFNFLEECDFDAMQCMPVRTPQRGRLVELAEAGLVGSFHQSWAHGLAPLGLRHRAVLSGITASTNRLQQVERTLADNALYPHEKLPVVVHPNEQHLGERSPTWNIDYPKLSASGSLGPLLHQPTVEVLHAWELYGNDMPPQEAADSVLDIQTQRGFAGIALDLHHLTAKRAGMQLNPDWVDSFVATLAAKGGLATSSELQVSVRPDFGGSESDVMSAVDGDFLTTRIGQLALIARDNLPPSQETLRITVEVPAKVFKPYGGYEYGNRAIVDALRRAL